MLWPQMLNDDDGHIRTNGSDDARHPMTITNYAQLFVLYCTDY